MPVASQWDGSTFFYRFTGEVEVVAQESESALVLQSWIESPGAKG